MTKMTSGWIGKPDIMRKKADQAFDGPDFKNFPIPPSSASAPSKEKMRLYKKGGSVKAKVNVPTERKGGSLTDQHFPYSIKMKKGGKAKVTSAMRKAVKGRAKKSEMKSENILSKMQKSDVKPDTGKSVNRKNKPANAIKRKVKEVKTMNGEMGRNMAPKAPKDKSGVKMAEGGACYKKGGKATKKSKNC